MTKQLTTAERRALLSAIAAALPDASRWVLVFIARGLGLDVPAILDAAEADRGPAPGVYREKQG